MPDLSILCVTKAEPCVLPLLGALAVASRTIGAELVLCADGRDAFTPLIHRRNRRTYEDDYSVFQVESRGYIESVLDACINLTRGRWIFRVDDDESIPRPLVEWLRDGGYKESDHWKFNRAHLFLRRLVEHDDPTGDRTKATLHEMSMTGTLESDLRHASFADIVRLGEQEADLQIITSPPLWPDHQTRLSTRDKSFGRSHIHCGSPHGGGELAPFPILHHKFVIKSREEREEILRRYDEIQPGAGGGFWQFSVPERMEERSGRIETISYDEFVLRGYTV